MKKLSYILLFFIILAFFPSSLSLNAQTSTATRVFYDGFESGNTNLWSTDGYRDKCITTTSSVDNKPPLNGTRQAECNWDGITAWNTPNSYSTLVLNSWPLVNEQLIRVRLRYASDVDERDGNKALRLINNNYSFIVEGTAGAFKAHWELVNGASAPLYWGSRDLTDGNWHTLEIYEGPTGGRFWIDDVLVYTRPNRANGPWSPLYLMSNWSSNPGWEHDANNHVYWDEIEIFSDSASGSAVSGSLFDGTIMVSGSVVTDVTPPTVFINSPSGGSILSNTVTLSANASDNVGVAGVQFRIDGVNVGTEDNSSPYSISWDSTTVGNGTHTLTALARDTAGNTTLSTGVTISLSNTTNINPPAVPSGLNISGDAFHVNVLWTDTSNNETGFSIERKTGSTGTFSQIGTASAGAFYYVDSAITSGTQYFYRVRSYNNAGNSVYTNEAGFIPGGNADVIAPTISMSSPANSSTVSGTGVTVSANASDNVGVVGVQFKLDGVNLSSEDTSAPYSATWNTTTATNGNHTLTAVARDSAGNSATALNVSVNVNNVIVPAPTADIKANNSDSNISIASGNSVAIFWSSTNATSCSISPNGWTGTSGLQSTGALTFSRTYTLSCSGAGGTVTDSVTVNITSIADTTKPTVSITAPVPFTTTYGIPVFISADATDNVGVVGVQFQLNGVNLGTEDIVAPYSIIWETNTTSIGNHNITAIARDVAGNRATSLGVNVFVNEVPVVTPTPVPNISTTPTVPDEHESEMPSTALKIGDTIKTTAWINVRSTAGGRYVGSQRTGRTGTITAGPGYANNLTWWKVNFTSGADGWVAEKYITKVTVAMTEDDYRQNIANIYLIIKYLQERIAGQN